MNNKSNSSTALILLSFMFLTCWYRCSRLLCLQSIRPLRRHSMVSFTLILHGCSCFNHYGFLRGLYFTHTLRRVSYQPLPNTTPSRKVVCSTKYFETKTPLSRPRAGCSARTTSIMTKRLLLFEQKEQAAVRSLCARYMKIKSTVACSSSCQSVRITTDRDPTLEYPTQDRHLLPLASSCIGNTIIQRARYTIHDTVQYSTIEGICFRGTTSATRVKAYLVLQRSPEAIRGARVRVWDTRHPLSKARTTGRRCGQIEKAGGGSHSHAISSIHTFRGVKDRYSNGD